MRTLFIFNLVADLLFGIGFAFFPKMLMSLYGTELAAGGVFMTRMYGVTLLSLVVLLYYAQQTENQEFVDGTARAMFIFWVLGVIFIFSAMLTGLFNWLGWITIGFDAFFAGWYVLKFMSRQ